MNESPTDRSEARAPDDILKQAIAAKKNAPAPPGPPPELVNATLATLALGFYLGGAESSALAATGSRAGDYVMASGSISTSREAILVVDTVAKRANLYAPKIGTTSAGSRWELLDSRNLAKDFAVEK